MKWTGLFDNFLDDVPAIWTNNQKLIPVVYVIENEKGFKVEIDLPGMKQEDVDIDIKHSGIVSMSFEFQNGKKENILLEI